MGKLQNGGHDIGYETDFHSIEKVDQETETLEIDRHREINRVCGAYRKMSREYESDLVLMAQRGCLRSRDKLVCNNLRFICHIIIKSYPGMDFTELLGAATMGMIEGIERFDPETGNRLISYAVHWIRRHLQMQTQGDHLIRRPSNQVSDYRAFVREQATEDDSDWVEVGRKAGLTMRRTMRVYEIMMGIRSLDAPIGGGEEGEMMRRTFGEILADEKETPLYEVEREDLRQTVRSIVDSLEGKERDVIYRYFGMSVGERETLAQIGNHWGVTRERVRQVKESALMKLTKKFYTRGIHRTILDEV